MESTVYHIYDKLFKKILTLSSTAVINLINGLFDTDYATDSVVTYNWTEFENEDLRKILADTILTIDGRYSYHMEAQMEEDESIILRVFDYGYSHALRNATELAGKYRIKFPEPKVIYLYATHNIPDEYELEIDFGQQGIFPYKVTVCNLQEITTEELNKRKMVILIPFALLRVRALLKKKRSEENKELLKAIIQTDIIGSINKNLEAGNITVWDARRLKRYTHKLYEEIYSHYEGMEELNEMTDESLILDVDIVEKQFEEMEQQIAEAEKRMAEVEKKKAEAEKRMAEVEKKKAEAEKRFEEMEQQIAETEKRMTEVEKKKAEVEKKKAEAEKQVTERDKLLIDKDKEIMRLKEALMKAGIQI